LDSVTEGIFDVEEQCPCAQSGVVASVGVAPERISADCGVPDAGSETKKRIF
jgi:hypothetical protein